MLPAEVTKHRFTVEEYHKMGEAGVFGEDDRVELVDGEIVEMTPIGWRHVEAVDRIARLLWGWGEDRHRVSVQNPLVLHEYGEHQPDLMLFSEGFSRLSRLPEASDVLLVVEVADSSLSYDRAVKLPRYAAAGIPEVWIVDLTGSEGALELYAHPQAGRYLVSRRYGPGDTVVSVTVEGLSLPVDEVLP